MSRSNWGCRNPRCPATHGAVLGHVTAQQGLMLDNDVKQFAIYLDTRRAEIRCPSCGTVRQFRGTAVMRGDDR